MTIVAVITQAAGRYCLESLSPAFAHVWVRFCAVRHCILAWLIEIQVMVIEAACVSVAMYCLIQFYIQLKDDLREHKPLLKVAAIKLVIFLSFWQTIMISFLTSTGAIKASPRIAQPDIKIGIPALLLCIEMAIFSVFHLWAFPWQVYDIRRSAIVASESAPGFLPDPKTAYRGGPFGTRALMDAFNPWDLIKAVGRGFKWFAVGRRTREQDISYKNSVDQGQGLERSRNTNLNGPWRTDDSFDSQPRPYMGTGGKSRYQPLDGEDNDHLLSHAQSAPQSIPLSDETSYPRPMIRHPTPPPNSRTPVTQDDLYPDHLPSNPRPASIHQQQQQQQQHQQHQYQATEQRSGVIDPEEATSYHGASITPIPHHEPAPSYLYESDPPMPAVKGQRGDEWDVFGGAKHPSESDLGWQHRGQNEF